MSDFARGMDYADMINALHGLMNVASASSSFEAYSEANLQSVERMASNIRTSLSMIDRKIKEARERIAREHNQKVAAE